MGHQPWRSCPGHDETHDRGTARYRGKCPEFVRNGFDASGGPIGGPETASHAEHITSYLWLSEGLGGWGGFRTRGACGGTPTGFSSQPDRPLWHASVWMGAHKPRTHCFLADTKHLTDVVQNAIERPLDADTGATPAILEIRGSTIMRSPRAPACPRRRPPRPLPLCSAPLRPARPPVPSRSHPPPGGSRRTSRPTVARPCASWQIARHYRVTWSDALHQHDEALEDGGRPGILNEHAVRSALARPYHGYHRRIHEKAAALLHGIVSNHGFVDGNKRTGLYLIELLLRRSVAPATGWTPATVPPSISSSASPTAPWTRTR